MQILKTLFLSLSIFLSQPPLTSWSEDLRLFKEGVFNEDYDDHVRPSNVSLEEDIFLFSNDRRFLVMSHLGKGGTTRVFHVQPLHQTGTFALRVPKKQGLIFGRDSSEYINAWWEGYQHLKEYSYIPRAHDYLEGEYILLDAIEYDFNGVTFFEFHETLKRKGFSDHDLKQAEDALYLFAKEMADLKYIGDFKLDQIVYSRVENKWYLIDWMGGVRKVRKPFSSLQKTIFDGSFKISIQEVSATPFLSKRSRALFRNLKQVTLLERKQIRKLSCEESLKVVNI